MPSKIKVILFSIICLAILSQYTNCDNYGDYESGLHFNSGLCFEKNDCATPSADKLQLSLHSAIVPVSKLNGTVVVTGDCSAGNYESVNINYSYSAATAGTSEGLVADACVNGQFLLSINLNNFGSTGDVVTLTMEISGVDKSGRTIASTRPPTRVVFPR